MMQAASVGGLARDPADRKRHKANNRAAPTGMLNPSAQVAALVHLAHRRQHRQAAGTAEADVLAVAFTA